MYTDYWKLNLRPFDNSFQAAFYYPSESHQATILKLRYAIENRRGAALMAGASGLGKTLLVRSLIEELPERYRPQVHVQFPQMPPDQLLAYLADELTGESGQTTTIDQSLRRIQDVLASNADEDRHALIIFDEAHSMRDAGLWETIRLLLNFESAWTMLLVGQPSLLPVIQRIPELEERLSVKCLLRRFSMEETISYISHRMVAAGATDLHTIFDPTALETVHQLSEWIPRRINRLCDLSLLIGFAEEQATITAAHVEAVAEELVTASASQRQAA